jgi:hypothetical protein
MDSYFSALRLVDHCSGEERDTAKRLYSNGEAQPSPQQSVGFENLAMLTAGILGTMSDETIMVHAGPSKWRKGRKAEMRLLICLYGYEIFIFL